MHINGELENVFIEHVDRWNFPDFNASDAGRIWYHTDAKQFIYNNGSAIVPLVDTGAAGSVAGEQQIIAVDSVTFEYRSSGASDYPTYTQFWTHEAADGSPETYTHFPTPWTFGKHFIISTDYWMDTSSSEFYIELPEYRQSEDQTDLPPVEMGSFRITNKSNNVININVNSLENDGNVAFYASSRKINPGTTALFQLFYDSNNINGEEWQTYWAVIFEETSHISPLNTRIDLVPEFGAITLTPSESRNFSVSLNDNVTQIDIDYGGTSVQVADIDIIFSQDYVGGHTVTLPYFFKPLGQSATSVGVAPYEVTILTAKTFNGGNTWYYAMQTHVEAQT